MRGSSVGAGAWPIARLAGPYVFENVQKTAALPPLWLCRRSGQRVTAPEFYRIAHRAENKEKWRTRHDSNV
jgi:hypothetical protein